MSKGKNLAGNTYKGDHYTGKEHAWYEGWGYFGAPAHVLALSPNELYAITKQKGKAFVKADANSEGKEN